MRMDRQTDRHDEANSRFSQFYECAYSLDIRWPVRESNQPFLEYDSGALLLHQRAQYLLELFPNNMNIINRKIK